MNIVTMIEQKMFNIDYSVEIIFHQFFQNLKKMDFIF